MVVGGISALRDVSSPQPFPAADTLALDKLALRLSTIIKLKQLPDEDFSCLKSQKQLNIVNNDIRMLPFSLANLTEGVVS